jgi:elongation factor G
MLMKQYALEQIRNVALAGHGGSGKTTLAEHLLYIAGHIDRVGSIEAGNTTSDFDPEEQRRKISLSATLLPIEWEGHKINLIDAPGFPDFIGELYSAIQVVDSVILVAPAQAELEVGFENAWELCEARKLPRLIFVNKMERDGADYNGLLQTLRNAYGNRIVPLQIPIGTETQFKGVIDVLHQKAYVGKDRDITPSPVPAELQSEVERAREMLMEAAAETDDALLEKYLDGNPLTDEELVHGFHEGVRTGHIVPVLCGSAALGEGLAPLLQAILELTPSPAESPAPNATDLRTGNPIELTPDPSAPLAAFVFKTTADPFVGKLTYFRVYAGALRADSQVYNAQKERDERIGQVFYLRGKNQIATTEVRAGDIGVVAKLQETSTGHTLCDKSRPVAVQPITMPDPIYTVAVVAKTKADEDRSGTRAGAPARRRPHLPRATRPRNGANPAVGHGRPALRSDYRQAQAQVQYRSGDRRAAHPLPRDDHAPRAARRGQVQASVRRARTVRTLLHQLWSHYRAAQGSSSPRASSAAQSRKTTSPPSRKASANLPRRASKRATPPPTSR